MACGMRWGQSLLLKCSKKVKHTGNTRELFQNSFYGKVIIGRQSRAVGDGKGRLKEAETEDKTRQDNPNSKTNRQTKDKQKKVFKSILGIFEDRFRTERNDY